MKRNVTINKTLFNDKQIEMLCDKIDLVFDILPLGAIMVVPAIVIIVAIVWGDFK